MSRFIGPSPYHDHVNDVLAAAHAWRERCFMADGSVFGDEALWTLQNVRELSAACAQGETASEEDRAWDWLKEQMDGKRPEILRLAAEAVWLTDLFPKTTTVDAPTWKRNRIYHLWRLSGAEVPDSDHLSDRALRGIRSAQPRHWWLHLPLRFLLETTSHWKAEPRRVALGDEPWPFIDWLDSRMPRDLDRPMRHQLLYLLYPDFLEPIGRAEKDKIVRALGSRLPGGAREFEKRDQAIYEIRKVLEREHSQFDFHDGHIRRLWISQPGPADESSATPLNVILYGPSDPETW